METNPLYWIWLGIALEYGSRAVQPLIDALGDAATVYAAGEEAPTTTQSSLNKYIDQTLEKEKYWPCFT